MKKILSLIVLTCVSVASAGSILWGPGAVTPPDETSFNTTEIYLVSGPTEWTLEGKKPVFSVGFTIDKINTALSSFNGNINDLATTPEGYTVWEHYTTFDNGNNNSFQDLGLATDDSYAFFLIYHDTENNKIAVSTEYRVGEPAITQKDVENGVDGVLGTPPRLVFSAPGEDGWHGAVPEPTVLALLALGVAGIALKRKKVVA